MSTHDGIEQRDRPIGEVASDLARDLPLLVRQEPALAKTEMREKGRIALPGLGLSGGAVVVAYGGSSVTPSLIEGHQLTRRKAGVIRRA